VELVGATAHDVTENLDSGSTQRRSVEDLTRPGADVERVVLSRALLWHCENRII
jgi:formyltetrahydrofolate deformylase